MKRITFGEMLRDYKNEFGDCEDLGILEPLSQWIISYERVKNTDEDKRYTIYAILDPPDE